MNAKEAFAAYEAARNHYRSMCTRRTVGVVPVSDIELFNASNAAHTAYTALIHTLEQADAWQEALECIASYLSVGVEGCTPDEAVSRIKKAATDGARVQMERAERAEAAIAPMVETAQNQQEEIHRLWVTFSKASEILGIDPKEGCQIPRPPSGAFIQAISRLVAERNVAMAALKEAQEQPAVAWLIHEYQGTGDKRIQFNPHVPGIRDEVVCPVVTALYTSPVPTPTVAVPAVPEECGHLHQPGEDMNIEELKRLAEAVVNADNPGDAIAASLEFMESITPIDVLELIAEIERLSDELDLERLRLSSCGVAAMQNTVDSWKDRITPDHRCYSASYSDVCRTVDAEILMRQQRDELLIAAKDAHQVLRDWAGYIPSSTIQEDLDMLGMAIANAEKQ